MNQRSLLVTGTVLYLTLPLWFFAVGWLKQPTAILVLILLFAFLIALLRDLYPSISQFKSYFIRPKGENPLTDHLRIWGIASLIIFVWTFFSGVGGFGYQTLDYLASNALIKDLIERPWPLTVPWNGAQAKVVYYIGWYLPATFVGKIFGWSAANSFMWIWAFIGLLLSFSWFWKISGIRNFNLKKMFAVIAVFCLAGGLDFIGFFFLRGQPLTIGNLGNLDGWTFLQYSSNTTLIYWVPQQAIPAWLLTGLVMDCSYGYSLGVKYLGIALAGCLLASPFGVIGILPYLLVLLMLIWRERQWQLLFNKQSVILNVLALPVAIMVALYLSSNKFSFPKGFLWTFTNNPLIFMGWFEFCLMEFGFLALFVFVTLSSERLISIRESNASAAVDLGDYLEQKYGLSRKQFVLFAASVVILTWLPAYKMGYSGDFVMRASIPALFIFWSFISRVSFDLGLHRRVGLKFFYFVIISLLVIGFYNSLAQIAQSVNQFHFGSPDENTIANVATANYSWVVEQRIGNDDTFFYKYFGK